jgi:hypothetical protein
MRRLNTLATTVGKGLVAGFVGTAAMTVSNSLEAQLRHRAASSAPARATAKLLGITEFEDEIAEARFNDLSHWGYGTSWGIVRGLLAAVGLSPTAATAAHGAPVWGSAQAMIPALEIAPTLCSGARRRLPSTSCTMPSTRPRPASRIASSTDERRRRQAAHRPVTTEGRPQPATRVTLGRQGWIEVDHSKMKLGPHRQLLMKVKDFSSEAPHEGTARCR